MSGVGFGGAADKPEAEHPARGRDREFEEVGFRLRDVGRRQIIRKTSLQYRVEGRPPQVGGFAGNENAVVANVLRGAFEELEGRGGRAGETESRFLMLARGGEP